MFLTEKKFKKRVEELDTRRYGFMENIAPFIAYNDELDSDTVHSEIPEKLYTSTKTIDINDRFVGRDGYLWIYKEVTIPEHKDGFTVTGLFDFGRTGEGGNCGFESILYVDGKAYQGVDTNHYEVNFEQFAGKTVKLVFMLWTGLEGGGMPREIYHRIKKAQLGYTSVSVDKLYFYGRAISGALSMLNDDDTNRYTLIDLFEAALKIINWDEDKFFDSCDSALCAFNEKLEKCHKHSEVTVNCVGHTHIDVAWLWRLKHTREKAQRSFSTVNRLMDDYDEYKFLQSQPQIYDYLKSDSPEIYSYVKNRVNEGKWEPDGGMWLEADCNISSGEALTRQMLKGTQFFEKEFGRKSEYLWLPDVFGYSWALPQILKLCNIKTFMTTKISWNQYNNMPNDLFKWRGIDGSEILTYFITTPHQEYNPNDYFSTYNGEIEPFSIIGSWKKFRNKDLSKETLVSYGFGDGGGGVTRHMLEMRRAMDALPGFPNVKTDSASHFFDRMHENVDNTENYVPVWDGEFYFEFHRGTYTSQGMNKRYNRKTELRLTKAEWLNTYSALCGGKYDSENINEAWKILLRNQFHDIIPGSSIREVYEDSHKEYELANSMLENAENSSLATVCEKCENSFAVINPCPQDGIHHIFIATDKCGNFYNNNGAELSSQKADGGYVVSIPLKALSTENITIKEETADKKPSVFNYTDDKIKTPYYDIAVNENGEITSLFDKENSREVLSGKANVLEIYEDKPGQFDAWDIDIFYQQKPCEYAMLTSRKLIENGNLRLVVRSEYKYNKSTFTQDMIVYSDSRRIDFVTHADWHEDHRMLKAAFNVDVRNVIANYDIQYGHASRPTHYNTSWDYAKFEVLGHKWVDLSDDNYGVAILNDCKYGHSVFADKMAITLLKSSKEPDYAADMGEHDFTYSMLPHSESLTRSNVIRESWILNSAPDVVCNTKLLDNKQLIKVADGNVLVDAVKMAEDGDGIIVRMHEFLGGKTNVKLCSDYKIKDITPCNLLEESLGDTVVTDTITDRLTGFELKTYRIHFE